jgi:hypothetical protein
MTPYERAELITAAEKRGITVVDLDSDEYVLTMRGAFRMVQGEAELLQALARMGVDVLPVRAAGWADYEAAKRAWLGEHPGASPDDYEQAMQRIAVERGS